MAVYNNMDDLPSSAQKWFHQNLTEGERFVVAVRPGKLIARINPYFAVTDRRFIKYRNVFGSVQHSTTFLEHITQMDWRERNFGHSGTLELEGPEIDESQTFTSNTGKPLVDALREQLAKQKKRQRTDG